MTDAKNSQAPKSSTIKVFDKQSLYKYLYSLFLFELLILAAAGLSWLILRDLSCLWVILGFGQALIIGSAIIGMREYSVSLVVQKMKEKSSVVEPRSSETVQGEVIEQQGNSPEFKIHATYAIDLPKLSAHEQKVFDALSRNLKLEYVLWSVNIYLLLAVTLLWFDWEQPYLLGIEIILFCGCLFRLPSKGVVVVQIPLHLTTQEPRGMKIGLILYMTFRAVLSVVVGQPNTFFLATTASIFAITICISILLYGLRRKVKGQGFPTVNMLALWVFGTQNIWKLLEYLILPVWRRLGNIFLIRGGEHILRQVSLWDTLLFLRGKDRIISKTPEQITQRLNEFRKKTNRTPEYRFNTLICGDNSWQFALHSLIDDADMVVMHLSSFSPSNQGCIYELEQLINRVAVENFFLLVDRHSTDYNFLTEKLQDLWKKMKSSSPNQKKQIQGIQIIFVDHVVKTPDEVEVIYKEMNSAQQNALDVLADDPHKKELVIQHETRYRQELEGLFRVLFAKAVQLKDKTLSST
jgi:hypothetical protein